MTTLVKDSLQGMLARRAEERHQHKLMRDCHQGMVDNIRQQMEMTEETIRELKNREEKGELSDEEMADSQKVRQAMEGMLEDFLETLRRMEKDHKKTF